MKTRKMETIRCPVSVISRASRSPAQQALTRHPLAEELAAGLARSPKRISSKFFYDDEGSRLFARITDLPEYYLTRCEEEILLTYSRSILESLGAKELQIVELGAGDGRKTRHLLRAASRIEMGVRYRPVDISTEALAEVERRICSELPHVPVEPLVLDLEHEISFLPLDPQRTNLVLYLGSSLGNLDPKGQLAFVRELSRSSRPGDFFLIGFDLRKDVRFLKAAYDDGQGVTRDFNFNLLLRFNREFGAQFELSRFQHLPTYNPATAAMESWLLSLEDQDVWIEALGRHVHFDAFEAVHVETSWKFTREEISRLAWEAGFQVVGCFEDRRGWFVDALWMRAPTNAQDGGCRTWLS